MRTTKRPRSYVPKHWLLVLRPVLAYNAPRDAYVLRGVGKQVGPVLRPDRRLTREQPVDGIDYRRRGRASLA